MGSSKSAPFCLACCEPSPAHNMASGYYSVGMNDIQRTHYHKAKGPSSHAAHDTVVVAFVSLDCYHTTWNLKCCPCESCQVTVWAVRTEVERHSELGDSLQGSWTWLLLQHVEYVVLGEMFAAYMGPAWAPLVHNSEPCSKPRDQSHGQMPGSYSVQMTGPSYSRPNCCLQSSGTFLHKRRKSRCLSG